MKNVKLIILILCVVVLLFFLNAPTDFPVGSIVTVNQGDSLRSVSLKLKQGNVIRSRILFEAFIIMYGGEKHIIPADYLLDKKETVYNMAKRIERGERHLAPIKVTIPEGFTITDIAEGFDLKLTSFNKDKFMLLARQYDGTLFPDTYFFFTDDTEAEVIKAMRGNYEKKVGPLRPQILASKKTEKEIIIFASLVEGEANGEADREYISGILWRRLNIGMALQVDVSPETYQARGLPKSPVGNPGLKSILATLNPKKSDYLYYLHDKDGTIHYAKTYTEHNANIKKYLKN
jgi:UPF0755 protein